MNVLWALELPERVRQELRCVPGPGRLCHPQNLDPAVEDSAELAQEGYSASWMRDAAWVPTDAFAIVAHAAKLKDDAEYSLESWTTEEPFRASLIGEGFSGYGTTPIRAAVALLEEVLKWA